MARDGKDYAKTGVGLLAKFLGCGTLLAVFGIIIVVVIVAVLLGGKDEEENSYSVNGSCDVKGGEISDKGKKTFEQNAKGGALEGKTDLLIKTAKKYDIPPSLFIAIIASESEWGKGANATDQKNPLSVMGAGTIHSDHARFPTLEKGLKAGAKNLQDLYISEGLTTPEKIGPKYAPTEGATNDPKGSNNNWIPTVKSIMKDLGGTKIEKGSCSSGSGGKALKLNGKKLPKWSNSDPGKENLYTAGQCTWYAFGIRQKMGKPISTFWHDAHNWDDRAKEEGYKVDTKPEEGAVFVADQGAGGAPATTGHVAIVIEVKDKNNFVVSEMNVKGGPYHVSQRTLKMTDGYHFIHDK
ncbi:CHAP domain-containing protein [Staphylococcus epidermidis]|uniref:CHAP domain-containing protein n=1 Tax=Staphylococcus epidermidis TaxID=1282 RepID=UPI0034D5832F